MSRDKTSCYHGAPYSGSDVQWRLIDLRDALPSSLGRHVRSMGGDLYEVELRGLTADEIRLIGKTLKEAGTK